MSDNNYEQRPEDPAFVDADDAKSAGDELEAAPQEQRAKEFGESVAKVAADAAYATVGFVGLVSDRVKEFYDDQKKQYAADHPDMTEEPGAKHFLSQLGDQLDRFVDDLGKSFRDMVDRGRTSSKDAAQDVREKAADAAQNVADAAQKAADKAGFAAQKAADEAGEAAQDAAGAVDDLAQRAADDAAEHAEGDPRLDKDRPADF